MNNKKGAQLAIGTIIMIILGLVVLVVVIYGFTVGWGNVTDKLFGITGGEVNVQSVIQSCELSCSIGSSYDVCTRKRDIVFEEGGDSRPITCNRLAFEGVGLDPCNRIDCSTITRADHEDCSKWGAIVVEQNECPSGQGSYSLKFTDLDEQGLTCCIKSRKICADWEGKLKSSCSDNEFKLAPSLMDVRPNVSKACCLLKSRYPLLTG